MRLIVLGPPGAGKGTQAVMIAKKLGIPHISTGEIFRSNIKNNTELGKKANEYIDKGRLVPDDITIGIVKKRLSDDDCKNGFILDGFPRTIPQAKYLEEAFSDMGMAIDYAVNIQVPDHEVIKRLSGRRVCPKCGRTYHIVSKAPKKEGSCEVCNEGLVQRDDDKEETIIKRLEVYHDQSEPLINFYNERGKLLNVESRETIEETFKNLLSLLGVKE